MRIRKNASRLLGSAYSASTAPTIDAPPRFDLPPPPHPAPCSAIESSAGAGLSGPSASCVEPCVEPCVLNRSPWDLLAELSLSDQEAEDDLLDKYFVHVTARASWLFSASMPATSTKKKKKKKLPAAADGDSTQLRHQVVKRAAMNKEEEGKTKKKAKVKKEEGKVKKEEKQDGAARVWMCKRNDGRRWRCNRPVSQPDTLCEYHLVQKRSYLNPGFESSSMAELEAAPAPAPVKASASKSSTNSNKPQKKKKKNKKKKPRNDSSATDGFYYYAGFGPFRSKRQCRSGGMNEPPPAKLEEEQETAEEDASHPTDEAAEVPEFIKQQAACQDVSGCDNDDIAGITGVDVESREDDYDGIGIAAGCNMDGTVDPQASSGEGKRKAPWKRWRKAVKGRSLKSLM